MKINKRMGIGLGGMIGVALGAIISSITIGYSMFSLAFNVFEIVILFAIFLWGLLD
jgi:hypothetical protein